MSNNTNTGQSQRRDSWGGNPVGLLWSSDLYFTLRFTLTGGVPSGRLTSGTDRTGRGATAGVDRKEERKKERKKKEREMRVKARQCVSVCVCVRERERKQDSV